jgi:hypothetical protein
LEVPAETRDVRRAARLTRVARLVVKRIVNENVSGGALRF